MVIKNGKIASTRGMCEAGIAIDDGRIISIAKDANLPKAEKTINAHEKILIPGAIDAHSHISNVEMFPSREDFKTGTATAAGGGITTLLDMPLSAPPKVAHTLTLKALKDKIRNVEGSAVIDFGLHAGATFNNIGEIPKLVDGGVTGFKIYMAESVPGFPAVNDDGQLLEIFRSLANFGSVACVHAENFNIVTQFTNTLKKTGQRDPTAFPRSRPAIAEMEAISSAIILAEEAKTSLHICHTSTVGGARIVGQAKNKGLDITAETCPQYLFFDDGVYAKEKWGPYAKMNPPIRSSKDVAGLWAAISSGIIDIVGSDHAPYLKADKEPGWEDIWKARSGAPGMETMLPLLLDQVGKRRLTLEKVISLLCENPAKRFGIYPQKGILQVGSDADLVMVDMHKSATIKADDLHTKSEFTMFEGRKIRGVPLLTICRGEIVMENGYPGDVIGKAGYGRFIRRKGLSPHF